MTTHSPDLDLDRLPFEVRRAIDTAGETMVELLEPGSLSVKPGPGHLVVLADGVEVGRIPLFRLRDVDRRLLTEVVEEIYDTMEPDAVAEARRLINAGHATLLTPAGADFVHLLVGAVPFATISRARVVPGWVDPPEVSQQ